jgi:hypothetical protein
MTPCWLALGFSTKAIRHRIARGQLTPIWPGVYRVGRMPLPTPRTTTKGTIPLSQPLFTLVDLAATLAPDPLEAAINEADRLGLVDPEGRRRDQVHLAAGRTQVRFANVQVRESPDEVAAMLGAA